MRRKHRSPIIRMGSRRCNRESSFCPRQFYIQVIVLFLLALTALLPASAESLHVHSIRIDSGKFLLDGQPFQIISGEMHYARIPREYWRDRMRKARAMGLNTISTYIFWDLHEPKRGVFDFRGQLDVAEFIRTAQEEGLYVIVRVGPYVCSEWELGGLPAWLLKDPHTLLRSQQQDFLRPVSKWLRRLGTELAPLQITRGGHIIAVQVENEYGSFGSDKIYMSRIRDLIAQSGLHDVILYTADGAEELQSGTLPDLPAVVNFGPGEAQSAFAALQKYQPARPMMSGEYWDGWFDHWGEPHNVTDMNQQAKELEWMLSRGYSVNLYMFHGGTTFGFMSGANFGSAYEPDTTSYDYDAPLDEAGRPTKKFFAFRDVIQHHLQRSNLPPLPDAIPIIAIPEFKLTESASLWKSLGRPTRNKRPKTMESLGQACGYILYRARADGPANSELVIKEVHDYAEVFVNGQRAGTLERRLNQDRIPILLPPGRNTLDILVENSGRINFGPNLRDDRKGITESVKLGDRELTGWEIYPLPMNDFASLNFSSSIADAPAFHRGTFELETTGDTFLDMRGLGKGALWINGHNLGRFWSIGPQQTLYVPGVWLRKGSNEVIVFDLEDHPEPSLSGLRDPILDELHANHAK
jgi:beta-galactosidase